MDWERIRNTLLCIVFVVVPCLTGLFLLVYGLSIMSLPHILSGAAILIGDLIGIALAQER
jgi:hypothetical protein